MKIKIGISLSIILNICLLVYLFSPKNPSLPPFEPFHNIIDFEYEDLVSQSFKRIPEDVPMLGKTIDNLTINYQFNDEGKCIVRFSIINLACKEIDTFGVYDIIESYNADIINTYNFKNGVFELDKLSSTFFVKHRTNNLIFKCFLDSFETGIFKISCSSSSPLTEDSLIKKNLDFWESQNRFGPDTTFYKDGRMNVENNFNWTKHGEDKWIRPDGSIESISYYNQGTNTKTIRYYPDGQLKSNLLSYNLTGDSKWYYPNGQLKEIIHYKDGEIFGEHVSYYPNGQIEFKGVYSKGDKERGAYNNGIKDGIWSYYDSLGTLVKTETFQNGSIIEN